MTEQERQAGQIRDSILNEVLDCVAQKEPDAEKCTDYIMSILERLTGWTKVEDGIQLGMMVCHSSLYNGNELMKVVGIREKEVELEGDYSGGTHCVCQKDWLSINGVIIK